MAQRYEEPKGPRFTQEFDGTTAQIVIPVQRNWFVLIFLLIWMTGWTMGGGATLAQLVSDFQPATAFFLVPWAIGTVAVVSVAWWLIFGREIIRVVGGDLEILYRGSLWRRRKLYRGTDICGLSSCSSVSPYGRYAYDASPFMANQWGSVKFNYGARTVYAASTLDEAEGKLIVDWLTPRLPQSATAGGI